MRLSLISSSTVADVAAVRSNVLDPAGRLFLFAISIFGVGGNLARLVAEIMADRNGTKEGSDAWS